MGEISKIEWTDSTFNPWVGCTKVSPACDFCYAESQNNRWSNGANWGPGAPRRRTTEANWRKPRQWDRDAAAFHATHGRRQRVFCASMADVFDNEVDPQWRADLFNLIRETPNLDWLLLTKRIGNATSMAVAAGGLPPNAALGATLPNQQEWDRDFPKLKRAAHVLGALFNFASVEPMLGPIEACGDLPDWVIVGGEDGPRPMFPKWARSMRDQCAAAGVPFLFKQWGSHAPASVVLPGDHLPEDADVMIRTPKRIAGRLLDGMTHDGFP